MSIIKKIRNDSIQSIEWVISIFSLAGGLYIFTPIYQASRRVNPTSNFMEVLSSMLWVHLWAVALIIGSLLVMFGLIKKKTRVKGYGLFIIFLTRFFQVVATILSSITPISWIYPLTISIIAVVLWYNAKAEMRVDG